MNDKYPLDIRRAATSGVMLLILRIELERDERDESNASGPSNHSVWCSVIL